jgi:hypothetical protein
MEEVMNAIEERKVTKICEPNFADQWMETCQKFLAQMEDVKEQVKDEFRGRLEEHQHLLELAMNEAEALAWQTDFPQLFFPTLAAEKAGAVAGWHARQRRLLARA